MKENFKREDIVRHALMLNEHEGLAEEIELAKQGLTFNSAKYAATFGFCTKGERRCIKNLCDAAMAWARRTHYEPPIYTRRTTRAIGLSTLD